MLVGDSMASLGTHTVDIDGTDHLALVATVARAVNEPDAPEDPEDAEFYRWYGAWQPLDPAGVAALMAGFDRPWWLVGGWSIEAFTGVAREHEDVDLSILRVRRAGVPRPPGRRLDAVEQPRRHAAPAERPVPRAVRRREPDLAAPRRLLAVGGRPPDHAGPRRPVDQQALGRARGAASRRHLGGRRRDPLPAPGDHPALKAGCTGRRTSATSRSRGRCWPRTGGRGCARLSRPPRARTTLAARDLR